MWLSVSKSVASFTRAARQPQLNRFYAAAPALSFRSPDSADDKPSPIVSGNQLELNSSRVVSLLQNLSKTPSQAISLFNQLKRGGFVHDVSTYAAMVRILWSWDRNRELESLLYELVENRDELGFEVFDLLAVLGKDGGVVSKASVLLVSALCRKGCLRDAHAILLKMKETGMTRTEFLCSIYIRGLCKQDSPYKALRIVLKGELPVGEFAFTAVIQGLCSQMKVEEAKEVLVEMKKGGFVPNVDCYGPVISGLCKDRKLTEAVSLHREMVMDRVKTNPVVVSKILQGLLGQVGMVQNVLDFFEECKSTGVYLDKVCCNIAMKAFCELRQVEQAAALLAEMKDKHMVPDLANYTTVIDGYMRESKLKEALMLSEEMAEDGIKPDIALYNVLASCVSRLGLTASIRTLLDNMKNHGIEPSDDTYSIIIEGLSNTGKLEDAEAVFDEFKDLRPDICNAMVKGYCSAKNIEKAFELFISLCKQRYLLKKSSCLKLLASLEHDNEKSVQMVEVLLALQAEYSYDLCSKAIRMLSQARDMEMARHLYDLLSRKALSVDLVTLTMMIQGYCKINCLTEALNLLDDMNVRGVKPDVNTCTVLLDGASKMGLKREDMEKVTKAILDEMKKMNVEPDAVLYTVLMHYYCKVKCLPEAGDLLRDMNVRGVKPDVNTYTVLLDGKLKTGVEKKDMEKVKKGFVEEMKKMNIEPDAVFYTVYQQAYCKVRCWNEARDLLHDMKVRGIKPDVVTFTVLLDGKLKLRSLEREDMDKLKKDIFYQMEKMNIEPNVVLYSVLMHGYCKANCWGEAFHLFRDMKDRGLKPNVVTYTVLLDAALKMGLEREKMEIVDEMNVAMDTVLYTVLMDYYCKAECCTKANDLLDDMKAGGVKPDVITYLVLLFGALKMGLKREVMEKVKQGFIDEMKQMKVQPDASYFATLIHRHCKAKNLQDAKEIYKQMIDRGVEPDIVAYTDLLCGHFNVGDKDGARVLLDEMSEKQLSRDSVHNRV